MRGASETPTLRNPRPTIAAAVLALACALAIATGAGTAGAARADAEQPPSFVVIQTDDQTLDSVYQSIALGALRLRTMPNVEDLIGKRGITFERYYVSYPLCCPSRVTLLTGRYAHNHNVRGNNPPNGGFTGFLARTAGRHNLAVWLQEAGYRTIHSGKVMNGFGHRPFDDGTTVPPGWHAFYGIVDEDRTHYFYGYTLNANGDIVGPFGDSGSWETREYAERDAPGCPYVETQGPCNFVTDKITEIAVEEIEATPRRRPFYVQVDYTAPHGDFRRPPGPEPAPRHYDWFRGKPLPHNRAEGLDEADVSDKPRFIREAEPLSGRDLRIFRTYYQKQLDSMRSVDDGVRRIIATLGRLKRLRNTYVIFLGDNGFFYGEHRLLGGKFLAYEPATLQPLLIRGPGIPQGSHTRELAANIDIAPTLLDLAGAKADRSVDGRSLAPYLEDPERQRTRRPILFESFVETNDVRNRGRASSLRPSPRASASILAPPKDYAGIRLGPYKYIAWPSGEKELYHVARDPNELESLHRRPNFFPILNFMHRQLERFKDCVGRECRETTPPLPLTRRQFKREQQRKLRERQRKRRERARQRARNE